MIESSSKICFVFFVSFVVILLAIDHVRVVVTRKGSTTAAKSDWPNP